MRESHPIEQAVGINYYISDADGIGGQLRVDPDDFRVAEIENFEPEPLDADPGAYPEILLRATLRSWDTNDFAGRLSDACGISRERVSWAGTKDKHAVTTQLFSVSNGDPDAIADLDIRGAEIEIRGRTGRPISFGDLHGNRFQIRVREADDTDNRIGEITDDLRAFGGNKKTSDKGDDSSDDTAVAGIPNWFGQQRFGSRRPVTHEVGLRIVAGEWREAVLTYVANPFDAEPEKTQAARQFVANEATNDDPDWAGCLDEMPRQLGYERSMLHRLADEGASSPADFRHALEAVPWNLQQLFVNAAQSSLFNRILSERLARGLPFDRPVDGDVCCFVDSDAPEGLYAPDTDRLQRVSGSRVGVMERHCDRGRAFVTAPLIGAETELADGEPGEIEREILTDVGIEPSDFELPGEFRSTGARRAILVRTDLAVDPETLTFSFALPSGSYATALLREYQKGGPLG